MLLKSSSARDAKAGSEEFNADASEYDGHEIGLRLASDGAEIELCGGTFVFQSTVQNVLLVKRNAKMIF